MLVVLIITVLLKVCCVLCESSFINNGQRAQLFEKMDNEVSTFKIYLPEIEFSFLKNITAPRDTDSGSGGSFNPINADNLETFEFHINSINYDIIAFKQEIEKILPLLKLYNLKKEYPNLDFNKYSYLNFTSKGYPIFNEEEILKEFNFDAIYYIDMDYDYYYDDLKIAILNSNKKYNILSLLITLSHLTTFTNSEMDNHLKNELFFYKFILQNPVDGKFFINEDEYNESFQNYLSENSSYDEITPYNIQEKHFERIYGHLKEIKKNMKRKLELLNKCNFKEVYPNFDFSKELPNLKINENGFANLNIDNIMEGFKFNLEDYISFELGYNYNDLNIMVYQSNPKFDILNILITLANITTFNNSKIDDELTRRLVYFKFISKDENNNIYTFDNKSYQYFNNIYNNKLNMNDSSYIKDYLSKDYSINIVENNNDEFYERQMNNLYNYKEKLCYLYTMLYSIQQINFIEEYPNYNFKEEFPELLISEDGFPQYNLEQVIKEFNFDPNNCNYCIENLCTENDVLIEIFQSNPNFNIIKLSKILADLSTFTYISNDSEFTYKLSIFKCVILKEDGKYYFDNNSYIKFMNRYKYYLDETPLFILREELDKIQKKINSDLETFKSYNFTELYPSFNFKEKLPELKVSDNGISEINIDEIMQGFQFDEKEYENKRFNNDNKDFELYVYQSNKDFNLLNIYQTLTNITTFEYSEEIEPIQQILCPYKFIYLDNMNNYFIDMYEYNQFKYDTFIRSNQFNNISHEIIETLNNLKKYNLKELCPTLDFEEKLPELNVSNDGYSKINVDEIIKGFKFKEEDYPYLDFNIENEYLYLYVYQSNKNFNLLKILMIISNNIDYSDFNTHNEFTKTIAKYSFIRRNDDGFLTIDDSHYDIFISQTFNDDNNDDDNINDSSNGDIIDDNTESLISNNFKTKNATMIVNINGKEINFDKVTFSLSGKLSRSLSKPQFKVKIRGKKDLYGRTQLKLRPDTIDPTQLRSKIISDIHNRIGVPSLSAGYTTLYINDEYMGLYILTDIYKLSWVEYEYGEKNATSLYKCDHSYLTKDINECKNENDDIQISITEIDEFVNILENANSASDIEDIFDINQFLTEMAIEYLTGGWEHYQNAHNYIMFKPKNGKWLYLSHDFDLDLSGYNAHPISSYEDFFTNSHLIDILILQDPEPFIQILKNIVINVFNPTILFPHIDELKALIKLYIEKDKTPDENGNYPGRYKLNDFDFFTMEQWEANCEYTTVPTYFYYSFGIKYWILMKYRYVCNTLKMECDPIYMDNNYKYVINKNVEYMDIINYYPSTYKYIEEYGEQIREYEEKTEECEERIEEYEEN
ncbi:hypothetical protein BCR32DRAFT_290980 [Anaeromyces robustus]|uniref:KRAB-related domain-containing protein n=1 Tax=Anaeromyces robustus TaxID=1754192 RepID=A0A1Y1XH02_9FUNG|nr:hypothetical protein BCR32DRAFT_290980 [Anaeromyces robustus]|eukprot:ORX85027.1 hypothetical protein BCR32DRAFT_290980 [Anaeromyces robustus]